ncbi:c-type cytochrome [Spirosoma telluris]|uniref:c-type cytochrome n=1 Tax=Spirosoma telluris TaxID=2183553 RepID=UPI002FC3A6E5
MIRPTSALGAIAMLIGLISCQSAEEIKRERYITEGILVYKNNCANCHQAKGEGLPRSTRPLLIRTT